MEVINFQLDVIKRFRQIYARQTAFGCGKCLTLCRIQRGHVVIVSSFVVRTIGNV